MKAALLLSYASTMLSSVLAITVPRALRAKDQANANVSISFRPAPPPSNATVKPVPTRSTLKIPIQGNYVVTQVECFQPTPVGPAFSGDCQAISDYFTDNPNLPISIPPAFIVTYTYDTCVFQTLNRDTCGTVNAVLGQFIPFFQIMASECVASSFDSVTNGEEPPVLMTLAGAATDPDYYWDPYCEDAQDQLRLDPSTDE